MRRFAFYFAFIGTLAFAAVLAAAFLVHAVGAMEEASRLHPEYVARFGNPIAELGVAAGVMISGLSALLACCLYAVRAPFTLNDLVRRTAERRGQQPPARE